MAIYGLFIGNNYKGTDYALPDCELDAQNVHKAFRKYCQSAVLLRGAQATRDGILNAARRMKARLKNGDQWLISNSSHGTWEMKHHKRVEAIVCDGGDLIYDFELDELLDDERAPDSVVTVFSDSCFSDGLARDFSPTYRIRRTIPSGRCRSHVASPLRIPKLPKIFFSGCKTREESFSTGHGGAMTLALLHAFDELGSTATFGELFERIGGANGLLPTSDWPQHPQCEATDKDLLKMSLRTFYLTN